MSNSGNYYSGGFAEIVSQPSEKTYSMLTEWFTGEASMGRAMKLLGLPIESIREPILELRDGELLVDLNKEEKTFYGKTIFKYKQQKNVNAVPELSVSFVKFINPVCLINTMKIISVQSRWIADPKGAIEKANELVDMIPLNSSPANEKDVFLFLRDKVWPNVFAVGMMCEFFNVYLMRESKAAGETVRSYVDNNMVKRDWFFRSISDMQMVRNGEMEFDEYVKNYGIRADKDYEIESPRWHEMKDELKKRIKNFKTNPAKSKTDLIIPDDLKKIADTFIELQLMRTEAKRRALIHFDILRKLTVNNKKFKKRRTKKAVSKSINISGEKGMAASGGTVEGISKNILNGYEKIVPGTIGIFPNASPEFTLLYPKCSGIIFLKGGQTSHGVIVAREFGIPALIDSKADGVPDGTRITIDGEKGEWTTLNI